MIFQISTYTSCFVCNKYTFIYDRAILVVSTSNIQVQEILTYGLNKSLMSGGTF